MSHCQKNNGNIPKHGNEFLQRKDNIFLFGQCQLFGIKWGFSGDFLRGGKVKLLGFRMLVAYAQSCSNQPPAIPQSQQLRHSLKKHHITHPTQRQQASYKQIYIA
jgi:hypothetical protein